MPSAEAQQYALRRGEVQRSSRKMLPAFDPLLPIRPAGAQPPAFAGSTRTRAPTRMRSGLRPGRVEASATTEGSRRREVSTLA
jgi:hypothetical protein